MSIDQNEPSQNDENNKVGKPKASPVKTVLIISLVLNLALCGVIIWCANRWESRFKEGYYQGQLKTYTQMETWGLGKVMSTSSELQFKLTAPRPMTVQVFNRNHRPNETDKINDGF